MWNKSARLSGGGDPSQIHATTSCGAMTDLSERRACGPPPNRNKCPKPRVSSLCSQTKHTARDPNTHTHTGPHPVEHDHKQHTQSLSKISVTWLAPTSNGNAVVYEMCSLICQPAHSAQRRPRLKSSSEVFKGCVLWTEPGPVQGECLYGLRKL